MSKVLVVDDHADTLRLLRRIIGSFGYDTLGASTGEAAMALLQTDRPDLIIVDGMMPGMNGQELIRLVRAEPHTASIPIILNTALCNDEFVRTALQKGANEVWIKGQIDIPQMKERLARVLSTSSRTEG